MHIKNDYFLLYHGKNAHEVQSVELKLVSNEHYPILSLLLTLKKNNFSKVIKLKNFKHLLSCVYPKEITTLDEIYPIQHAIFSYLSSDKSIYNADDFVKHIEYLNSKEILPYDNYKKLISLFSSTSTQEDEKTLIESPAIDKMSFQEAKEFLLKTIKRLNDLFSSEQLKKELVELENYLGNQIFSIGITGVINSGKSTMLNALIGKEVLGSSVVPETANLTIIKYAKPSAEVFYWSKEEWGRIAHGAKSIESIKDFVEETENKFSLQLDEYIKEDSFSEKISVEDISKYTSVKASNGKCNLVKYVDLYYDLEFLKDGIEIVDTPGLDDPVVQREEITKEYLSRCDVMLHLMNVSQSATAKDIEFIIDAILYQHISKILIVITHADTVSKKEIQEVIAYTKSSIKNQLERLSKSSRVNYILQHIDFIPISAKVALLHKTQPQKVKKSDMSMKESGFTNLEEYLQKTLFGNNNNKSELILRTTIDRLNECMDREIHLYTYALEVLSQSKEELKENLQSKKNKHSKAINLIMQDVFMYKNDSINYLNRLDAFLDEEFVDLKNIILQRLFSDVKYSYETQKKQPESSRSKIILETAIKDGIVDIIRDYRYKLIKKEKSYLDNYEKKFQNIDLNNSANHIDIEEFFKNSFKEGFLTFSTDVFISKTLNAIKNSKSSKLELFNRELSLIVEEELANISKHLCEKIKKHADKLVVELFNIILKSVEMVKAELEQEESFIQERLDNYDDGKENSITIMQNIKEIQGIKSGFNI